MSDVSRAAAELTRLIEIMATLRGPDGCPWDREQTIDSLKPFVLEETYEVLEAIDRHDHAALCEELGDFVFEAVFVAQLESEAGRFTIADSLKSVADKLVRRHPHVFARETGEAPLAEFGTTPGAFENTPLMIDDVVYLSTPYNRVVALDAETGQEKWAFDPKAYEDGQVASGQGFVHRGVAAWRDGSSTGRRSVLFSVDP